MTARHGNRCNQFMPRFGPHQCPCDRPETPAQRAWREALSQPSFREALDAGLADLAAGRTERWEHRRPSALGHYAAILARAGVLGVVLLAATVVAAPRERPDASGLVPPTEAPASLGAPQQDPRSIGSNAWPVVVERDAATTLPAATASPQPASSLVSVPVPTPPPTDTAKGLATWCGPTPTQCQSWAPPAMLGAVPSFRFGDEPYRVRISRGEASIVVTVVSFCACRDRHGLPTLVDLSPAAFKQLGPLSRGVLRVELEELP